MRALAGLPCSSTIFSRIVDTLDAAAHGPISHRQPAMSGLRHILCFMPLPVDDSSRLCAQMLPLIQNQHAVDDYILNPLRVLMRIFECRLIDDSGGVKNCDICL